MNKKIKFAIIGLILAVLILTIINFQLDREIIIPPSAAWKGVCADYVGIPKMERKRQCKLWFSVESAVT